MLTNREEYWWKKAIWGISFLGAPIILILYQIFIYFNGASAFPAINPQNFPAILGIVTTFSITMTGFIAAIGAYLLSISRTPTFNEWRQNGYLSVFFSLYAASIFFLLITFGVCLMMLLTIMSIWWLKIILAIVVVNLLHIISITFIVVSQAKADN